MFICCFILRMLKSVGMKGNGYIEVRSQPLRASSSFGLSFKTKQVPIQGFSISPDFL